MKYDNYMHTLHNLLPRLRSQAFSCNVMNKPLYERERERARESGLSNLIRENSLILPSSTTIGVYHCGVFCFCKSINIENWCAFEVRLKEYCYNKYHVSSEKFNIVI